MAGSFTAVDLSQLPFPDVVETLDFETIFQAMLADLITRDPSFTALVESDPAYKILEVAAYRELLIRQRVNEASESVMLAYAAGADLDQIAARYDVQRLLIQAADDTTTPPTAAVYEDDDSLRRRVQLSFEGFSTAGPTGAYIFHALGADADVKDVSVASAIPGQVDVYVLSRTGNGEAPTDTLDAVTAALNTESIRPLCDTVNVQSATIVEYSIVATIYTYSGPDPQVVMDNSQASGEAFGANNHRLGRDIGLDGVYAALRLPGVQRVALTSPSADIINDAGHAAYCTGVTLTYGGIGD